jgi:hypothetical protein
LQQWQLWPRLKITIADLCAHALGLADQECWIPQRACRDAVAEKWKSRAAKQASAGKLFWAREW